MIPSTKTEIRKGWKREEKERKSVSTFPTKIKLRKGDSEEEKEREKKKEMGKTKYHFPSLR